MAERGDGVCRTEGEVIVEGAGKIGRGDNVGVTVDVGVDEVM